VIGAMVVGPEFGPIAGLCVALVARRSELAKRSVIALAVGFPVGIVFTYLGSLIVHAIGIGPETLDDTARPLTTFISHPDAFSVIVAYLAGTAGILSLTSAKSGALVGVLISVTTIPAAGNVGLAAAYGDWGEAGGAALQLGINLATIVVAGLVTLCVQRLSYVFRRRRHAKAVESAGGGAEASAGPAGGSEASAARAGDQNAAGLSPPASSAPGRSPRR